MKKSHPDKDKPATDSDMDNYFHANKDAAKKDFNIACDLYRKYVGSAETREERIRRIQLFRCG